MKTFIAYYRVSTKSQGDSGLGLESQRQDVNRYVSSINGEVIAEYTDIESGKSNSRKNLWRAVEHAAKINAILVVKKFDRLSRGGLEIMLRLEQLNVTFIESDSPHDNTLLKELKFSIAKDEVKKISERTKSALGVIKSKIDNGIPHTSKSGNVVTSLGTPKNLSPEARENSIKSRSLKAQNDADNIKAGALIVSLRNDAKKSFYAITKQLNTLGFKTSKGNEFSEVQTKRLYNRFNKTT